MERFPVIPIIDSQDPAIESNVILDPDTAYVLSVARKPHMSNLTGYLLPTLRQNYGRDVEHIAIVPSRPDDGLYVLVNKDLKPLMTDDANNYGLLNVSSDEMNRQVSSSKFVGDLIEDILEHQPDVFVNLYKNSKDYGFDCDRVKVIAPRAKCVEYFDNKINQKKVVAALDLPVPRSFIANNFDELIELYRENFDGDAFITCSHGSSGSGSERVCSEGNILSSSKIKPDDEYVIADYLDLKLSPSTFGIIAGDGVYVAGIFDLIMDGPNYLGAISPTLATPEQKDEMIALTEDVGKYLGEYGYRGPYGIDFMIDNHGKVYFTEINPRVGGSTTELTKAHMEANPEVPSIPEIIYDAVIYDTLGFSPESCELPQDAWAHKVIFGYTGDHTKTLEAPDPKYTGIVGYPGDNLKLYTPTKLGLVAYRGNPDATRDEILSALDERIRDINPY